MNFPPFSVNDPFFLAYIFSVTHHLAMCAFGWKPFIGHRLTDENCILIKEFDVVREWAFNGHFDQKMCIPDNLLFFSVFVGFDGYAQ